MFQLNDAMDGSSDAQRLQLFSALAATLGLGGYFLWDLLCVFMYATPFAEGFSPTIVVALRLCWMGGLIVSLIVCWRRSDFIYRRHDKIFTVGCIVCVIPLGVAALHSAVPGAVPVGVCVVAWTFSGIAQAAQLMAWSVYFSLVTTRYTPIAIALASCLGTCLYIVMAAISLPLVGIIMVGALEVISFFMLGILTKTLPSERIVASDAFETVSYVTPQGAITIGTYGLAFGYTTTTLFSLGVEATIIGCATGIIGSMLSLAWYKIGRNTDIDISTIQRLTLPPVVIGILFLPFGDSAWRLFFCCVVNVALSHFSVISLSSAMIFNSEFSIKPLKRSAVMQIPVWVGLFVGSVISAFIWLLNSFSTTDLMFISVLIASLIVCAIAIYGLDDSIAKKQFHDLLMQRNEEEILAREDDKTNEKFDAKFDDFIKAVGLSPREVEVFRLLARGRNAEYISRKLVISGSTAKSHIYHIYRKMGINSQQSLIDQLEEYSNRETIEKEKASLKGSRS